MPAKRKIVKIDEEKCNGCGQCVHACHERAIEIIDGKAKLVSEIYCDGLGACIGECPQDAITIEEREAEAFDEAATEEHVERLEEQEQPEQKPDLPCGCPGMMAKEIAREPGRESAEPTEPVRSELRNWPVQMKLVPPRAPYLAGADLLLVADCVPFALADFHQRFLKGGNPVVVGCPKLDDAEFYIEKLADIITSNGLNSLTVVHMEVPCCSALTRIAEAAVSKAGSDLSIHDVTIGIDGAVQAERDLVAQR